MPVVLGEREASSSRVDSSPPAAGTLATGPQFAGTARPIAEDQVRDPPATVLGNHRRGAPPSTQVSPASSLRFGRASTRPPNNGS